jgi:RsiW-degrading membrane proteinase PrsW (M82 family)
MASQWQYYVFLALISYVAVALVEEGLKYGSLLLIRRFRAVVHKSEYVTYAMASALGFSTVENLAFIEL